MTTTTTPTLTAFLLARIEDDEAAARAINKPPMWQSRISRLDGDLYQFVSRQHPARVLAECEARREVVRRARRERGRYERTGGNLGNPIQSVVAWETAVRILAAPYSDHPDYDDSWRP